MRRNILQELGIRRDPLEFLTVQTAGGELRFIEYAGELAFVASDISRLLRCYASRAVGISGSVKNSMHHHNKTWLVMSAESVRLVISYAPNLKPGVKQSAIEQFNQVEKECKALADAFLGRVRGNDAP